MSAMTFEPAASPHAHGGATVAAVMTKVMLALVPVTAYGFWAFGWPAIYLWVVTVAAAVLGEALALRLMRRPVWETLADGSAMLTGWLLALSLPPWGPWWLGAIGGAFATVIGKQIFGGIGANLFNPAMVARAVLLVSFPLSMSLMVAPPPVTSPQAPTWSEALAITFGGAPIDAWVSATLLGVTKAEWLRGGNVASVEWSLDALGWLGARPSGSFGETSALLIVFGGALLMLLRVISWHIPLAVLVGVVLPALIAHWFDPLRYLGPLPQLFSGATLLVAFFIATDYVTAPVTRGGQLLYGLGIGLLTWLIRTYGAYPEGAAFAVLLMNALTPAIDHWLRPRIYGRDRRGRPLAVKERSR